MGEFNANRGISRLLIIVASLAICACSTFKPGNPGPETGTHAASTGKYSLGSFGELDRSQHNTRDTATLASGAGLAGKMLILDPLVRPVSTAEALYGATLKSVGGFVERRVIENVSLRQFQYQPIPEIAAAEPMDAVAWERELDKLTGSVASSGRLRLLVDGDEYYQRLYRAIDEAGKSIDIRTYIYDNDDVGLDVANRLRSRSASVDIRIMVDGLADLFATRLDSQSMPEDTVLPSSISDYLTYESRIEFRKQSNPWFTGDHAKITLIDSQRAFLGGMNIGREYRYDWHDLMMEIEGPIVARLQFEFDKNWARSGMFGDFGMMFESIKGYPRSTTPRGIPLRLLTTSLRDSQIYRAQVAAIRRARNRIYIQNAYFSDDKILFELVRARHRGVDVRVILGAENDSGIHDLSNQSSIDLMLEHGIRVYRYPGMTHVKAAVYDGWACLGSANFDKLSLQINREINLGFSDPATVQRLVERVFLRDFQVAEELHQAPVLDARHHFAELIVDELF